MYICEHFACRSQKRALGALVLKFQVVVSFRVGVGNQILVLYKSNNALRSLNHLSSPCDTPFTGGNKTNLQKQVD